MTTPTDVHRRRRPGRGRPLAPRSPPAPPRSRRPAASRADLLAALRDAGCFRLSMPESHGGLGADLAATLRRPRGARPRRRLDGLDGDDRGQRVDRPGGAAPRDLRRALRPTRRRRRGRVQPRRVDHAVRRRVSGHRPVGLRQRLRARRRALRQLRRRRSSTACRGCAPCSTPDDVMIEDTWTAAGLCGTGSHHFRVDDRPVPADRTLRAVRRPAVPRRADPADPAAHAASPQLIAAVAIGIAQGALDDLLALAAAQGAAARRRAAGRGPAVPGRPGRGRHRAAGGAGAARRDGADELWAGAVDGQPPSSALRARARGDGASGSPRAPRPWSTDGAPLRRAAPPSTPSRRCTAGCATCTR